MKRCNRIAHLQVLPSILFGLLLIVTFDILHAGTVQVEPRRPLPGQAIKIIYSGPIADGRPMFAHYGINGWNIPISGEGSGRQVDHGDVSYFAHRRMSYDLSTKQYTLDVALPANTRALHMAFCWNACGAGEWDNNSSQDYAWPIVYPFIGPILSWNEHTAPDTGIVISYESGFTTSTTLEVWRADQKPQTFIGQARQAHRFILSKLRPDTRYFYRLSTPDGFISSIFSFKTAPQEIQGLSFVVFGDAQDNGENGRFASVAEAIVHDQRDINFVLSTGDLPPNDNPGAWWAFFDKAKTLLGSYAFMPTLGNHDTPTPDSHSNHASFVRYFALPSITEDNAFYTFRYGPAKFFGMNSERSYQMKEGGLQYNWLATQLDNQAAVEEHWNFVYWHVPPFNVGARHYREESRTRPIATLLDGKVDWSFSGHEHLFQRFKPIRFVGDQPMPRARYGISAEEGVGYLVVPGAGVFPESRLASNLVHPASRQLLAAPFIDTDQEAVQPFSGYTRVDIHGRTMDLKIFSVPTISRGSVLQDRVIYTRTPRN